MIINHICIILEDVVTTYVHDVCVYLFSDEDKYYRIVHVSSIILGILTCGTSVLLWWLYSGIITKSLSSKNEYDVKGTIICAHMYCSYMQCNYMQCSYAHTYLHKF